jgi:hypothetical protein
MKKMEQFIIAYNRKRFNLMHQISNLKNNITRVEKGIDDYGNNERVLKNWNRELLILKLELIEHEA